MIYEILKFLDKLPFKNASGQGLVDILKIRYFKKQLKPIKGGKCLCGGPIVTCYLTPDEWETICLWCNFLYSED